MALDVKQLLVVTDYQLLEAAEAAAAATEGDTGEVIKARIPLLIRCLANDRHKTRCMHN